MGLLLDESIRKIKERDRGKDKERECCYRKVEEDGTFLCKHPDCELEDGMAILIEECNQCKFTEKKPSTKKENDNPKEPLCAYIHQPKNKEYHVCTQPGMIKANEGHPPKIVPEINCKPEQCELHSTEKKKNYKTTEGIRLQVLDILTDKEKDQNQKKGDASELIVEYILSKNKIYTTRDDKCSEMWIYSDGIFLPQGKTYILETCREILQKAYTTTQANQTVAKIEVDTFIDAKELFKNETVEEVPVQNGILNIFTKELSQFTPDKKFFSKLPITYKPEASCPNTIHHLETVLKNKQDVTAMQELFGYLLLKEYKIEKAFMLNGSGRNGKGKTLELMKNFIGPENCASIPIQSLEKDQFVISDLFGKMANLSGDLSPTALRNTGRFKECTGRDLLTAQRKFLPPIYFVNYAKMIFACNELPKTHDLTPAFWNRWVYFEFPYTFLTQAEIDDLPQKEKETAKLIDPDIIKKLTTPEELSGLLNWSLEGLHRLLKQKNFSHSQTAKQVEELWIRKSDSFLSFVQIYLVEDYDGTIPKKALKDKYLEFCKVNRILKPANDKIIKDTLYNLYSISEERIFEPLTSLQVRKWVGIRWK